VTNRDRQADRFLHILSLVQILHTVPLTLFFVGFKSIRQLPEQPDPLFRPRPSRMIGKPAFARQMIGQVHDETSYPVQAFRHNGAAYALQFHPDVTHAMMYRWTVRGHDRMFLPNAKQRAMHFAERAVYDQAERVWLGSFLDCWLKRDERA